MRILCLRGFALCFDDFSGTVIRACTEPDDVQERSVASIGRGPDRHYDSALRGFLGRDLL